jgi:carbon starvation protein
MILRIPRRLLGLAGWGGSSFLGASLLGGVALGRGEPVNAAWILVAAVCIYLIAYRWYSRFIALRVLGLDDGRATPAEVHDDGKDYVPTHRWVVFGHHFAAIAGPGPLVGPVLAAQLGYLPGLLWIVVGGVLGGCVQDFVILFASMRRDGRSLGQMARQELGPVAGYTALVGVLAIMVILLAVIGLVVVRALAESPWGTFTIACTIPIAILMGLYMRYWRPGRVEEASLFGLVGIVLAVVAGGWVAQIPALAAWFDLSPTLLAVLLIAYGYLASTLPVWMLLAPRDYLSTFVKIGVTAALALGILAVRPGMQMPAITEFAFSGAGPVWAGDLFPFVFITIACGAISGFHSLVSSGTTPKLISRESDARLVGYGGMMMESFVAVMAMLAACVLSPGVYFAMNSPPALLGQGPEAAAGVITGWGYPVTAAEMQGLAEEVGEETLWSRAGGAPTLAVGMARIFSSLTGGRWLDLWYHFAIMFEALFILTTLDAGTRVGRFMLQDLLSHRFPRLADHTWWPGVLGTSAAVVGAWGYFLYQGVVDPLGGINSLWPLFGIANQMLASIALVVATTVLVRMGRARYAWVTGLPLAWLVATTQTAGFQKIFSSEARVGFLAQAADLQAKLAAGAVEAARVFDTRQMIFNYYLDAVVAAAFALVVWVVLAAAAGTWWRLGRGPQPPPSTECPYVPSRLHR